MEIVLIVVSIVILIVALVLSYISYRTQQKLRQISEQIQAQQEIWEKAQNTRQQQWRAEQEKHLTEAEHRLQAQIHQLQTSWKSLEEFERQQREDLRQAFENSTKQARAEFELARIPRVEDVPLPVKQDQSGKSTPRGQRVNLSGADLSQRDLSSRYLGHANLSGTILREAKCFMADFSWANLRDADFMNADLSGANLTHTDLRGANLNGVNFLAADLYKTNLIGANLLNARHLTAEQLRTAVYDDSTMTDLDLAPKDKKQDNGATLTNMRAVRTAHQKAASRITQATSAVTPPVTPMPSNTTTAPGFIPDQPKTNEPADANELQWLSYLEAAPSTPVAMPKTPEAAAPAFDWNDLPALPSNLPEQENADSADQIPQGSAFEPTTYEVDQPQSEEPQQESQALVREALPSATPAHGFHSNNLLPDSLPETEGSGTYVMAGEPSALSPHLSGSSLLDLETTTLPESDQEQEQKEVLSHVLGSNEQATSEQDTSSTSEH